jgi:transcriptional regulator with PAS, ATPase and Fis domain
MTQLNSAERARGADDLRDPGPVRAVLSDPEMLRLDAMASALAPGNISVLLLGETGSGKEVFAEAIHHRSPRRQAPFVRINCAALSESLLESELFGHERGAFTGALRDRAGLLETASGGTVFLDEIGEMPARLQSKLLRVIEEGQVLPVGATQARAIDVRIVSATNRDLEAEVAAGGFRQDLYYRLSAAVLSIPPLRQRRGEIEALAHLFLRQAAAQIGRPAPRLAPRALERLLCHSWPGNVRELRNVMERALLLCPGGAIGPEHLPGERMEAQAPAGLPVPADDVADPALSTGRHGTSFRRHLGVVTEGAVPAGEGQPGDERQRILEALDHCAGNQTRAARLLGISRGTLVSRLTRYALPRPRKARPGD